jgi:hypothetical protein
MESSVAAVNAKEEAYKSRNDSLEAENYDVRVTRAGAVTDARNVRCHPYSSTDNLTFACRRGK